MRLFFVSCIALAAASLAHGANPQPTEAGFRKTLGLAPDVRMDYRDLGCKATDFAGFARGMGEPGAHADVDRAFDGKSITMTVRQRGLPACPPPYPQITDMPAFEQADLAGRRVTSVQMRGKPTLLSFYFSTCIPCILEVGPINKYAAAHPEMNFLAVTPDDADEARSFSRRYGLRWRVMPGAQDFIDRVRVKEYPVMALFDADGRLLGMKKGGARDEIEAAAVEPQLARWVASLLRK